MSKHTTPRASDLMRDLGAGLTTAIANVPDAMANAVLTGVNPVRGLYALMVGTPTAALTTSSQYLTVAVTAAMAIAVGDALAPISNTAERSAALVTLTLLIGAITVTLGLLNAGKMMRFVPNAVMRGFLTGVAINIVLGQVPYLTGSNSGAAGRVQRTLDIIAHPQRMDLGSMALAALTIALVLALSRTPARRFAMALALVSATAFGRALGVESQQVGDIGAIPAGLPQFVLPSIAYLGALLVPAFSIALIGLIQTAGVSKNTPNRDGRYPDVSRDFVGQGFGSLASALFGGVPVGGSVSSTATNIQSGARSRLSNVIIGPFILGLVLLASAQVEAIPMAVLAALLVIVGIGAIDLPAIVSVWDSSRQSAAVMAVTFVGTLLIPIQYAVLLGIGLTIVRQVYSQGADARVVGIELVEGDRLAEIAAPRQLRPHSVVVLGTHGSLEFAGAQALQERLPDPTGATGAIVILRLRGQEGPGSTLIEVLRRYNNRLSAAGASFVLAGVGESLRLQLTRTGLLDEIGRENVYFATQIIADSTVQAILDANRRLQPDDS
jgi:sulfate permease, SulP family